jgi:hypothetical protein
MLAHTTETMHKQMAPVGYEYVAKGWYCVDSELLRQKYVRRINDRKGLKFLHQKVTIVIDEHLRAELSERRVPGQKFVMFHICEEDAFEYIWFAGGKNFSGLLSNMPFGVFTAIPHFYHINDGPNMSIRYTEECSRCKEDLPTSLIGAMTLKYTLE